MHLHSNFRHIGGWSACKLALLITLSCRPGLQATPLHIRVHCCWWIIIFPIKMQIFASNNKNTVSATKLNYRETLQLQWVFFFKSINLKVPNFTASLKRSGGFFWSWNNFDWIRFLYQFCIKNCPFIQFEWCEKATDHILGLYSLSSLTARFHEVSKPWVLGLDFSNRSEIWQAPQQQRYWDCQISERYDYNI